LARFFRFCSVFSVQAYKTETEPVGFFKILIGLIGFFSQLVFFCYFFSGFLGLIGFSVFLLTPNKEQSDNWPLLYYIKNIDLIK
jgi:hypothetical protein